MKKVAEKKLRVSKWMAPKTAIELANYAKWKDVERSLLYLYPQTVTEDNISKFKKIFNLVRKTKKIRTDKDEFIELYLGENPLSGKDDNPWYTLATNKYSMSFRLWKDVCSLQFGSDMLIHYKVEECVAFLLWEMTYFGYSEKEMKVHADEVQAAMKDVERTKKKK